MSMVLWMAIGAITGRAIRVLLPRLLGLRDGRLPFSWPWVEITGALVFAALAWRSPTVPLLALVLATILLAVTAADAHSKLIPDRLTFPGTIVGVALNAWHPESIIDTLSQRHVLELIQLPMREGPVAGATLAVLGAVVGFAILEGFRRLVGLLANIEGMGMGDAKLLMLIGAFLGPHAAVITLLPACAVGALVGVVHKVRTGLPHAPFGPALAAGALIVLRFGDALLAGLWRWSLAVFELPTGLTASIYGFLVLLLVVLMVRLRPRAAEYQQLLDDDYREIEAGLRPVEPTDDGTGPTRDTSERDQGPV